jgi:hypothetical protein
MSMIVEDLFKVRKKAENMNLVPIWKDKWAVFVLNNGPHKLKEGHAEIVPKSGNSVPENSLPVLVKSSLLRLLFLIFSRCPSVYLAGWNTLEDPIILRYVNFGDIFFYLELMKNFFGTAKGKCCWTFFNYGEHNLALQCSWHDH